MGRNHTSESQRESEQRRGIFNASAVNSPLCVYRVGAHVGEISRLIFLLFLSKKFVHSKTRQRPTVKIIATYYQLLAGCWQRVCLSGWRVKRRPELFGLESDCWPPGVVGVVVLGGAGSACAAGGASAGAGRACAAGSHRAFVDGGRREGHRGSRRRRERMGGSS